MQIVSADSEPVQPYKVDEVILHSAERFDVIVTIPSEYVNGDRFWIKADTLESAIQGYEVRSPGNSKFCVRLICFEIESTNISFVLLRMEYARFLIL